MKVQKISPMKTATSLVRAVRLVSHGVSTHPSRLVMTSEIPETYTVMAIVPNWRNATTAVAPATITGPEEGIVLNTPAARAHSAACSRPTSLKATQVAAATTRLVTTRTSRKRAI